MLFLMLTFGPRFGNVPWAALPIGMMILGALHLNLAVDISPKYLLTDPLGSETSFPTVGGHVKLFCFKGNGDPDKVYNDTAGIGNKVEMKKDKFELEPGLIGTKYGCISESNQFTIGPLHCNPFNLKPNVSCKEQQWCMISKDGKAKCKNKDAKDCFLASFSNMNDNFKTSFPTYPAACTDRESTDVNKNTIYGYCHAMSESKPVFVLSKNHLWCFQYKNLLLNSIVIKQGNVNLLPYTSKNWVLEYPKNEPVSCVLVDSKMSKAIKFTNTTSFDPKIEASLLPKKINLACKFSENNKEMFSISTFLIVYDPDISKYGVSISKKLTAEHLELACSCNVPEGFVCGLTWEEPKISGPKISDDLQEMPEEPGIKKLSRKDHARPIVYTCYMRVLAFDYPYTYKLKPVPLSVHKEANITVDTSDFGAGNDGTNGNEDNNGAGKGKTGNGKDGKGKNNNNENKSNEDSKSNKTATIAAAIAVSLVLLLAAAAIVGIVMVVLRRRKRAREEEEQEQQLEIQRKISAKRHERDMSFINSIKDSPNKVDSAFVALFYQARLGLSTEKREREDRLLAYYKRLPNFAIIATYWDSFKACVPAPEKLISLNTRYTNSILISTWLYKDHVTTPASKAKTSQKPEVLHMSVLTDIFMVPRYLACQAPSKKEMALFLKALIDQGITLVVCLLAETEFQDLPNGDIKRYFDYISLAVGESMTYENFTLFCVTIHPSPNFVTKVMHIKHGENVHKLFILRYLAWPDVGVGPPAHLLELCNSIRNLEEKKPGRTMVHCSAGIGRTGCLLASLLCLQLYDFQGLPFDISAVCLKVRKERYEAIQKFTQYAMVFWVVAAYDKELLEKLAPVDKTLKQELTVRPKVAKVSESPVAKDKHRSSASSAPKVTPSKQRRESKSTK